MTKKTRLRAARIAAAAVFAAGASLTAAGAAQAVGLNIEADAGPVGVKAGVKALEDNNEGGVAVSGTVTGGDESGGGDTGTGGGDQGGAAAAGGGDGGGDAAAGGGDQGGGDQGGGDTGTGGGDQDGGDDGQTAAGTGSSGDNGTCILDEDSVKCEEGVGPDQAAEPQQVGQQAPAEELAETGATEVAFLLVGAATMIAGGVAFRMMPRIVARRTAA